MAAKPLTTEAIVLTEKMDMTLDDIIRMSKNTDTRKPKRVPVESDGKRLNFEQVERSGVTVSQKRAASGGFAAKQAEEEEEVNVMPKQRPQTLDSLFADMKEQRMRVLLRQNNFGQHGRGGKRRFPWGRGRFGN